MAIWIVEDNCTGCGLCVRACPYGAMELADKLARLTERCTECGACLDSCKFEALQSDIAEEPLPDLSAFSGVWVLVEVESGALARVSLELLGEGARLAGELGQELCAVLMGHEVTSLADELAGYGAQKVYMAEHPDLAEYATLPYARVLSELVSRYQPAILLMGATPLGRDLAPRISRRLDLGLTADCTVLAIDPDNGGLLQTRPAFGGNIMATIVTPRVRPQMATVRPGVMALPERQSGAKAEVVLHEAHLEPGDLALKLVSFTPREAQAVDLSQAKVIVAGGRGCGGREGFGLLQKLAKCLGAELGGTRVAVEEGWLPPERQIGQTGQTVRPELYVACGISGAIQHRAGCMNARYIAAINRDSRAPIFKVADYALVGDLFKIVPALIEGLEKGGRP